MARADDIETPTMVVFDLDPGAPAAMAECAEVGLLDPRRARPASASSSYPKTSGSKGLQLYVPLNTPAHPRAGVVVRARGRPGAREGTTPISSSRRRPRQLRKGKVLIDWSQNSRHKTTICAYSLRARPQPTVSTPVTWDEVDGGRRRRAAVVRGGRRAGRVDEHGDLFEPTLTEVQHLPSSGG